MVTFNKKLLERNARLVAREIRQETGHPAKVKGWEIVINGLLISLKVQVHAYDGIRQRSMAI